MNNPSPEKKISGISGSVWQFNFDQNRHTYTSTTHVTLHTGEGIQSESDSLTSTIHFSIATNRTQIPATISGTVDGLEVAKGKRIGTDSSRIEVPFAFEGILNKQRVDLDLARAPNSPLGAPASPCTSAASTVLGDIRTLLITLPEELTVGLKWTDTISTTTCNTTRLNSAVRILRSYNVIGDTIYSGSQALVIRRTESTEFDGRGAQGQHEVSLTGTGTGLTTIYVDKRGIPLAVETSAESRLTITASGQNRQFSQRLQQIIKLLN
jgi:hypothetical protein